MMMDEDVVEVSPSSTYRMLRFVGLLNRWNETKTNSKGTGFIQPQGIMYFAYNSDNDFSNTSYYQCGLTNNDQTPRHKNVYGQDKWARVHKSDFNLNIFLYVSTSVEDEKFDLVVFK